MSEETRISKSVGALGQEDREDDATPSESSTEAVVPDISSASTLSSTVEMVGRYRVIRLLGEGGFGSVYLAEDETLCREVAVKVPRLGANTKKLEKEFLKEARQLAQLKHPGIVSVFDIGRDGDRCFIVSDFLSGPSLSQWLKKNTPDWTLSAKICMKIADALAHAHAQRTVHRDLKPSNIILTDDMQPVIVDFGLAVSDGQRADGTQRGDVSGTPAYMSPEQAAGLGHRIDGRTDIYSLGAILYRMLTGRLPFRSRSVVELLRQVMEDEPQPPRQLARHIPSQLEQICLKAMEKGLRDRYTTADDMANDLRQLLGLGDAADSRLDPTVIGSDFAVDQTLVPQRASPEPPAKPTLRDSARPDAQEVEATLDSVPAEPAVEDSDSESRPSRASDSISRRPGSDTPLRSTSFRRRESQRRQVTIINCSCDVYENDQILESLDSEEQATLLDEFQSYCCELATEAEGTVLHETDEGVAVCFGFPLALEDSVRRALRFGLTVRDQIGRINEKWKRHDVELSARVTVHTDNAIAEASIDEDEQTSSVSIAGAIRNVSNKLADFAEPGCVVVSQQTWQLCRTLFDFESLGSQKVRGLPGKVNLYEVVCEHSRDAGFDGTSDQGLTPLIGRDREIGLLQERWEQAAEGMGQVVLVIGDAGLGKSRLVHSIKNYVMDRSTDSSFSPIAEWRASSQRHNSSLYPAIEYFERRLGFEYGDSDEVRLDKLAAHLKELGLDGDEEIALLAGMLSIPLQGRVAESELPPQARKEQLLQLLLDWLRELSYRQPLLFVIEDLHWMDPSTLEFLELLVSQGLNDRILTLFTFRPEFETPWGSRAHQTNLALNRLTRRQVVELMEARAGRSFPEAVVDQIIERTDGVPLFVEEFTKLLIENDQCGDDETSISTMNTLQQIPASLHDMLMSRLDRIDGDIGIMQLGAAIGRSFTLDLIEAASGLPQEELTSELQKLVDAELLFTQGRGARIRYNFKHALIQDAAYNSLIKKRRQEIHLAIAEAFEDSFPEVCEKEPEVVARHFTEAAVDEKSLVYWDRASERSLRSYAYREAIEQINCALQALKNLPESRDHKFREIELYISLGVPLQSLEGYSAPSVEQNYARAYQLCQEVQLPLQFIPVLYGLFRFYMLKARHDKARELGQQLVDLATQADEADYFLFAHRALAGPMIYQGEYAPAIVHLDKAMSIPATESLRVRGRRYDVVDPWVAAGSYRSWALWFTGFATQAQDESQRAIANAEALNHPFSLTLALSFASWLHQFSRDVSATLKTIERARSIAEEQGFQFWTGWHQVMLAWARGIARKEPGALEDIREGIIQWNAQGSELGTGYFHELLADVALTVGRPDEADAALNDSEEFRKRTGEVFSLPEYFRLRGKVALSRNDTAGAEAHFRQALDVAKNQNAKLFELRSAVKLGQLLERSDQGQEAREIVTGVRAWFTEGFETRDLKQADKLLNELGSG